MDHDERITSPEDLRNQQMERSRRLKAKKKRQQRQRWIRIASVVVLSLLILLIVLLCRSCGAPSLTGIYSYDSVTQYSFEKGGIGAMMISGVSYEYSYSVKGDILSLDFLSEGLSDCSYTFTLDGDTLTLVGGVGTIGGTYVLMRQK